MKHAVLVALTSFVLLQQTFRTGTDIVFVDVSVRDGGKQIQGLTPADFVLTDNGVRQRLDAAETSAVPIDLTLVVDVSGSSHGTWGTNLTVASATKQIEREIQEVTSILRNTDRLRVVAIDDRVQLLVPMQPAREVVRLRPFTVDGRAAVYDTLAAALIQPAEPARRHVVVARTKGRDTMSSVTAEAIRAIAERSDAQFHLVLMETAFDNDSAFKGFQCQLMGFCWETRRFWTPFTRMLFGPRPQHLLMPEGLVVAAAAESTGGALHKTVNLTEPSLTGTFRKVFDDFRSGYVLRYTPEGVARAGWHTIDVKVPGRKSVTVRARRGYGIEEPVSTTPAAAPAPTSIQTIPDMVAAYNASAFTPLVNALQRPADPLKLLRDFDAGGNPWPANPHREAAFALELVEPAIFSSKPDVRDAAIQMLERFTRFVRLPLEPDAFERYWHFAAITLLEGTIQPNVTTAAVDRALKRFPDEPRFLLSRAIALDQQSRLPGTGPVGNDGLDAATGDAIVQAYGPAIAARDTTAEAHIRVAWLLHRLKRDDAALSHLASAGAQPIGEPALQYLQQLFRGHVLATLSRDTEAAAAYRAALTIVPKAQSARVGLMHVLLRGGDRTAADALAIEVQTDPQTLLDPWWAYWQGQYRLHPQAMARVRELSR